MNEKITKQTVPVNYGLLLENQLKKWQGGGHHTRGIAEYISNSDDSYRRLGKYEDQDIVVEVYTKTGKKIDKLTITDMAEGMSFDDLEGKFFRYFESFSGREHGARVTGRFGTGGKAYAIMNFRHCWIESVQNGIMCKAWFKWDSKNLQIIRDYNNGGCKNLITSAANGTRIILESSFKVNQRVQDFVIQLEKLARIRHILKNQKVKFIVNQGAKIESLQLKYAEPDTELALKTWRCELPEHLRGFNPEENFLILRYYELPLRENAFIDVTDGISSVADIPVSSLDGRPFSKYVNGTVTIPGLIDSVAVKENRRGLEEGDDFTEDIIAFLKSQVTPVINEIEETQRQLDKERRVNAANKKLNELSRFLSKRDLQFKFELDQIRKRLASDIDKLEEIDPEIVGPELVNYRRATSEDNEEDLIKGNWTEINEDKSIETVTHHAREQFIPNEDGNDTAVQVGKKAGKAGSPRKKRQGLQVLFSNDTTNPESPTFTKYDDPVSDRDLVTSGTIWINAVHPIIVKFGDDTANEIARDENIANFVLMMVAQFYAQKEAELLPGLEPTDLIFLYRKHFFQLQMELRLDKEISYFNENE